MTPGYWMKIDAGDMQKIIFILVTVLLLACTAISGFFKRKNKPALYENKITITGNTRNIEGHAAVVADSTRIFYVDGMDHWEDNWLNQKVKITGDLEAFSNKTKLIKGAVVLLLEQEYMN